MKSMRQVWALTVVGALGALAAWAVFWLLYGDRVRGAGSGNLLRQSLWTTLQGGGSATWFPWIVLPLLVGAVAYAWGRSNYRGRQQREQRERLVHRQASVPHPMD